MPFLWCFGPVVVVPLAWLQRVARRFARVLESYWKNVLLVEVVRGRVVFLLIREE